jgi:hypothetical protein
MNFWIVLASGFIIGIMMTLFCLEIYFIVAERYNRKKYKNKIRNIRR